MEISLDEEDFNCLWFEDVQSSKYTTGLTKSQLSEETGKITAVYIENLAFIFAAQKLFQTFPDYFQLCQEAPLEAIEELKTSAQNVEGVLAKHGLKFAENAHEIAGSRIVLINTKSWYRRRACPWNWHKPILRGIEKAGNYISNMAERLVNPAFRESLKVAEKRAKELRHGNLVHSEEEVQKAVKDAERELKALIQKSPKALDGLWDGLIGGTEIVLSKRIPLLQLDGGKRIIEGVMKMKEYGIDTKSFFAAQSNYNKLVTENYEASYRRCLAEGYQPKLIFHPNPTQVLGTSFMDLNMGPNGPEVSVGLNF